MKKQLMKLGTVLMATVLLMGMFGTALAADQAPIKMGTIQDLTGPASMAGLGNAWGVQYAVDEINAGGGINGRMIELTSLDCKNDATEALNAYRKLVDEVGIDVLIGPPLSNSALTWVDLATEDEIPCVGHFMDEACTTNPETGEAYPYMFLAEPGCIQQAYCMAKYAMEDLKLTSYATLYNSANAFAISQAKPFMDYVKANGGEVVAEETFGWTDTDYTAQCIKVAEAKPEAVFLSDYTAQAKLCIEQLRDAGFDGIILGANTLSAGLRTLMPEADLSKVYFLANYDDTEAAKDTLPYEIMHKYMDEVGIDYTVPNACFGYDAVMVMANALTLASDPTDGVEVRDILESQTVDVQISDTKITLDPAIHRPVGMGMYIGRHFEDAGQEIVAFMQVDEDALQ